MTFDSLAFLLFFSLFLLGYYTIREKWRIPFTILGSYFFYSSINFYFFPLIALSTIIDFFCSNRIERHPKHKKIYLIISLCLNLGVLFFFKYFNFFGENMNAIFSLLNISLQIPSIDVTFPIGISFYTIQTIGYTVDVYRGEIKAEKNIMRFALFVCFFPQLIAGPLERAKNLIPQIANPFKLDYFQAQKYTFYLFLGLARKVIISDRIYEIIKHSTLLPLDLSFGVKSLIGSYFMFFRLYYDFSSYSLMAVGIAGLLGIRLSFNFNMPQFATNISIFWRHWHITLHEWLKDYIYKPLRGSHYSSTVAIFAVFVISGIWHGANWNFVFWGSLNAIFVLIYTALIKPSLGKIPYTQTKAFKIFSCLVTFHLMAFTTPFYFFTELEQAFSFIVNTFNFENYSIEQYYYSLPWKQMLDFKWSVIFIFIFEAFSLYFYVNSKKPDDYRNSPWLINSAIITLLILVILFGKESGTMFRYYYF